MRRVAALSLALVGAAGCAGPAASQPRDLVQVRAELRRVAQGYDGEGARAAIAEAEAALDAADEADELHPDTGAADDAAYVARRLVEQARLAVLHAADRDALFHARAAARNLAADLARREAFFADLGRRREAAAEDLARLSAARRDALERARDTEEQLLDRPPGLLFRVPAEALFLPGTSLLRSGAEARLASLAAALHGGPACDVCLQILDDVDGFRSEAWRLADRRRDRIHDVLRRHGVPAEAFVASRSRPPRGAQVDLLVLERPLPSGDDGAPPGRSPALPQTPRELAPAPAGR